MKRLRNLNKKGFTLIELVVVIVILAILALIIIPRMAGFQDSANASACNANLRILNSATALYVATAVAEGVLPVPAPGSVTVQQLRDGLGTPPQPLIGDSDGVCTTTGSYSNLFGIWYCDEHNEEP